MRQQRGASFTTAPTQDFQQKVGWYPADPNIQAQVQPFYQQGQAAPIMISPFTSPPVAFSSFQGAFPPQVQFQQFPGYRPEAIYQEEPQSQLVAFRQAPQPVAQALPFKPPDAVGARAPTAQIVPAAAVTAQIPANIRVEPVQAIQIPQQQQNTFDITVQSHFDNLNYPIPGIYSIVKRGNLPGIEYVPN